MINLINSSSRILDAYTGIYVQGDSDHVITDSVARWWLELSSKNLVCWSSHYLWWQVSIHCQRKSHTHCCCNISSHSPTIFSNLIFWCDIARFDQVFNPLNLEILVCHFVPRDLEWQRKWDLEWLRCHCSFGMMAPSEPSFCKLNACVVCCEAIDDSAIIN